MDYVVTVLGLKEKLLVSVLSSDLEREGWVGKARALRNRKA